MTSRIATVRTHFAFQRYLVELMEDLTLAADLAANHPNLDEEQKLMLTATFSAAAHRLVMHEDPHEVETVTTCDEPEEPEEPEDP